MTGKKLKLFRNIFIRHRRVLSNLSFKNNNQLLIGLAGVPGSGKTRLAREVAKRYHAVRISNDEIRRIIGKFNLAKYGYKEDEGQRALQEYLLYFLSAIIDTSRNKLFVLDSGIERKYPLVKKWCKKQNYRFYIIRIALSRKQLLKNLKNRRKSINRYLPYLNRWFCEYQLFSRRKVENVVFKNTGKYSDLSRFVKKLNFQIKV